jgi:hypothetical protein
MRHVIIGSAAGLPVLCPAVVLLYLSQARPTGGRIHMSVPEDLRRQLEGAHAEALRVGDSPLRADQLANRLPGIARTAEAASIAEELRARIQAALGDAERVLRRDDDGREAARHLQGALRLLEQKPRPPSPFLDE